MWYSVILYLQLLYLIICNYFNYILIIYLQVEVYARCGVLWPTSPCCRKAFQNGIFLCSFTHFLSEYSTIKLLKSSLRGGKSRTSQDVNQSEMSIEQGEGVHYTRSVHIKDSLFEWMYCLQYVQINKAPLIITFCIMDTN